MEVRILVDEHDIEELTKFNLSFGKTGNILQPLGKNEVNQINIKFTLTTSDAIIWLYTWIHKTLLDGFINKDRDDDILWITGTPEFINVVYHILYKTPYKPNAVNIESLKL